MANSSDAHGTTAPLLGARARPRKKSGKKARSYLWVYCSVVLVLVAMTGIGTYVSQVKPAAPAALPILNVDLPLIIADLRPENGRTGYIRLKISLEVDDKQFAQQLRPLFPRLVDGIHSFLREYRRSDLVGDRGTALMRGGITLVVEKATRTDKKFAVLFRDIKLE